MQVCSEHLPLPTAGEMMQVVESLTCIITRLEGDGLYNSEKVIRGDCAYYT